MLMPSIHPLRRFGRLAGACLFLSLVAACTQSSVEKFVVAATPVEDVGACAFLSEEACAAPDATPAIRVAHAADASKKAVVNVP